MLVVKMKIFFKKKKEEKKIKAIDHVLNYFLLFLNAIKINHSSIYYDICSKAFKTVCVLPPTVCFDPQTYLKG